MRPLANPEQSWPNAETGAETLAHARPAGQATGNILPFRTPSDEPHVLGAVLTRTVTDEVIPRLVRARRPRPATAPRAILHPTQDQVLRLVQIAIGSPQSATDFYVEALRAAGTPVDWLLLDLIAPAAHCLGTMWEEDSCDFTDVSLGTLRLNQTVRRLGKVFAGQDEQLARAAYARSHSALLAQMPGEQHGLGLTILVQFFRRAGWHVRAAPCITRAELIAAARTTQYGLIGISVACDSRLELLADDIRALRKQSANRAVSIMVGGPPFIANPQLAGMVGADATALDARAAVQQADRLVRLQAADQ
jgi:methanogenic corrinoid protein MtbC1